MTRDYQDQHCLQVKRLSQWKNWKSLKSRFDWIKNWYSQWMVHMIWIVGKWLNDHRQHHLEQIKDFSQNVVHRTFWMNCDFLTKMIISWLFHCLFPISFPISINQRPLILSPHLDIVSQLFKPHSTQIDSLDFTSRTVTSFNLNSLNLLILSLWLKLQDFKIP
jgi:hypothetical protein